MQRRRFVQMMTLAGAGTIAAMEVAHAVQTTTVSYRVKGFSCPTCAVGLETMLREQKGVKWVKATYPEALVVIRYEASSVSESALRGYISELGFTAEETDGRS
ncbi:MAG TPA: heavy-metal-associated domain-containing protein [Acidobacteriaceae bacterium]|nr:heavy-metal-associated domain-containing protein [Acidobacteriaceae bacterium]